MLTSDNLSEIGAAVEALSNDVHQIRMDLTSVDGYVHWAGNSIKIVLNGFERDTTADNTPGGVSDNT